MPFSCAVVDIRLPDIDGFKLLKVIKVNYPQLPVIIITGYDSDADFRAGQGGRRLSEEALRHGPACAKLLDAVGAEGG